MSAKELQEALDGPKGSLDGYLEARSEAEIKADIRALTAPDRREHFAAMALNSVTYELNEGHNTIEYIARELGIESRDYDHKTHWDQFIARRTVLRADALLAELAKDKP